MRVRFYPEKIWLTPPLCCIADWVGLGVVFLFLLALVFA